MPKAVLLHRTETPYGTGQAVKNNLIAQHWESHQIWDPGTRENIAVLPLDVPARALEHPSGTLPETNNRPPVVSVWQVEIVGFSADSPTMNSDDAKWIAQQLISLCSATGTPLRFDYPFPPVESAYGPNNGVRLDATGWLNAEGVIGHCHAYNNVHADPGDITPIINAVKELTDVFTPEDVTTMQQTFADVLRSEGVSGVMQLCAQALRSEGVSAGVAALVARPAEAPETTPPTTAAIDYAALAKAVVDEFYRRLAN